MRIIVPWMSCLDPQDQIFALRSDFELNYGPMSKSKMAAKAQNHSCSSKLVNKCWKLTVSDCESLIKLLLKCYYMKILKSLINAPDISAILLIKVSASILFWSHNFLIPNKIPSYYTLNNKTKTKRYTYT